jgi:hypothetical protein
MMNRAQQILTKAIRSKREAELMQIENENQQAALMWDCKELRKQSAQLEKQLSTMKQKQNRQTKALSHKKETKSAND